MLESNTKNEKTLSFHDMLSTLQKVGFSSESTSNYRISNDKTLCSQDSNSRK